MLVSDLSFVFRAAPSLSAWFWCLFVFFNGGLDGLLDVLEVFWCCCVGMCSLCFRDCCFYFIEDCSFVFHVSVGGEGLSGVLGFSRDLFVENGEGW